MMMFGMITPLLPQGVASADPNKNTSEKVNICHQNGQSGNWNALNVSVNANAWQGHEDHSADFLYTGPTEDGKLTKDGDKWCADNAPTNPPTPVDVCPNIPELQTTVPQGKELVNGNCVDIVVPPAPSVTISATKVVCDAESYLPNKGAGGWTIDATTAQSWVDGSSGKCKIDPMWQFQWGDQNALDAGATFVGEAAGYTTFTAGTTTIPLAGITEIHLREVLKAGYIPFTGQNTTQDVSAEFYCTGDALNYDNWDFIRNPQAGQTYHCVGFNAPVTPPVEPQQCAIVSDTTNVIEGNIPAVQTWTHSAWVNSTLLGSAAKWIWNAVNVVNPTIDETEVFTKQFSVTGTVSAATLEIAADNGYLVKVNNTTVADKLTIETNYGALSTYDVSSYLVQGTNTLEITVKNFGVTGATPETNPAGLLYKLSITAEECADIVTPPAPQVATVTMCKVDEAQKPLSGWTLMLKKDKVQDLSVPSNLSAGVQSDPLSSGMSYIAQVAGTWLNQGGANPVDAEYSTTSSDWSTNVMDGYTGYSTDILELQIDQSFDPNSTWGPYNSLHTYARSFVPSTTSANFRIFDGTGVTQNEGWFGDNSGALNVSIFGGYAGVTGENGCVVFQDVPYGTYTADEIQKAGWENVSGLGTVAIDSPTETVTIVNRDTTLPPTPTNTSGTTVVKPGALNGWEFNSDRSTWSMGIGSFVAGPTSAPIGNGSARITTPTNDERTKLRKYMTAGIQISDIQTLKYSTYRSSPNGGALIPALQFDVNFTNTPIDSTKADARIVYESYHTQQASILDDTWQEWDALNDAAGTGTGSWWIAGPNPSVCPMSNPCTWAELNNAYPDMQISGKSLENTVDTQGAVLFKAGGSWSGFDGNVDKFVIGIKSGLNTHTETYDFEPAVCSDGISNDEDGLIDQADPACHSDGNAQNPESYTPDGTSEVNGENVTQCSDGIDNDNDGKIDYTNDTLGCSDVSDDNETDPSQQSTPTGGGGGSVAFVGGGAPSFLTPQGQVLGASTSCGIYLDDYLKRGARNNSVQVKKLQEFLNNYLALSPKLPVTGFFGPQTYAAVVKFQEQENDLVLKPWVGVTLKAPNKGTGYVYKTTKTRINNIMCPELNLPVPAAVID